LLMYHRQDYEASERFFNRLLQDYQDVFYGFDARGHLLKIYYETNDMRGLESLLHSFRMFLDRNKDVAPEKRRQYVTFLNHLRKLLNIPLNDRGRIEKLKKEILEKESKGMGISWLIEKIDVLLGEKIEKP
ncbi:MAG: hypothetical protein AAF570_27625, partial [Bacteroidota bacterium]